jgi:hypothetical protein
MPLEAEVERVCTPVESELTLLALVLMPDDAEVESELTPLLVVDRPVERDVSLL